MCQIFYFQMAFMSLELVKEIIADEIQKCIIMSMGCVAQLIMYLTADTCQAADPGVASLIQAQSYTFVEIDHEMISMGILLPFR